MVNRQTKAFHEEVVRIGGKLGLRAEREASISRGDATYAPRLDILWTRPLSVGQRKAIEGVRARLPMRGDAIPIAAWEVEGSDVSTRGMQADLANMRVSGAPFGFLAVRGDTKDNLYERACRLTRTQRHYFGDQAVVPLDTRWLSELALLPLSSRVTSQPGVPANGDGGEGTWARSVRDDLRKRGEAAGFDVIESFSASFPARMELTQSKIDLGWTLPMPEGLSELVKDIGRRQKGRLSDDLILSERYASVVVVAFEIENDSGKHGHGGILNLASHGMAGVFVAGSMATFKAAEAAHETYRETLPLSRVTINDEYMK